MLPRSLSTISDKSSHQIKCKSRLEQDFVLKESLGKGGFGEILKAKHKCDGSEVAIKIIKFKADEKVLSQTKREVNNLSKLNHKNIVRYHNSWIQSALIPKAELETLENESNGSVSYEMEKLAFYSNETESSFEVEFANEESELSDCTESNYEDSVTVNYLCIHMELCDKGTLRDSIDKDLYKNENRIEKFFQEICEGLRYIHSNEIVHRDLKPENILLIDDTIKIGDFGLSKNISRKDHKILEKNDLIEYWASLSYPCGTVFYTAPEFYNSLNFTTKADVYSLGVIYLEMNMPPMTQMEKSKISLSSNPTLKKLHPKKQYLIRNLLDLNYQKRPTCEEILQIINSKKSLEEIKEMVAKNKKMSFPHFKTFERKLVTYSEQQVNIVNFITSEAVKIFDVFGGRQMIMPTFLPCFNQFSDNLLDLLSPQGIYLSLADTSKIAFAYYIAKNNITKIRRYSTQIVFKEDNFSPVEDQECVFQVMNPEADNVLIHGEMIYMAKTILETILPKYDTQIYINDSAIFDAILKHCDIRNSDAERFRELCIMCFKKSFPVLQEVLIMFQPSMELINILLKLVQPIEINEARKKIMDLFKTFEIPFFSGSSLKKLEKTFAKISSLVTILEKFGIDSKKIFLHPLLVTQNHSKGVISTVGLPFSYLITCDAFDGLIRKSCKKTQRRNYSHITAIELSVNIQRILRILVNVRKDLPNRTVDVIISTPDKTLAIQIFRRLLLLQVKCEIVQQKTLLINQFESKSLFIIRLETEKRGTVLRIGQDETYRLEDFNVNLLQNAFLDTLANKIRKTSDIK